MGPVSGLHHSTCPVQGVFAMTISPRILRLVSATFLAALLVASPLAVRAGHFGFRGGAVGGISVDGEGVVREAQVASQNQLREALERELKKATGDMKNPVAFRWISLKNLHAAIVDSRANNHKEIPDEIRYLAGLTRIQFVVAMPEEGDILLGGPAEGWRIDRKANVVGITSGRPILQLDDLLVALRSAHRARTEGISCSIDPTPEGLQQFAKVNKAIGGQFSRDAVQALQEAMGHYTISLQGVPGDSHFARTLVAADVHMKRLAMKIDPSPIPQLPSYLDLVKNSTNISSSPRWWLACNYDAVLKSEDGLTWQLQGQGVKCLTEDDIANADGTVTRTGKSSPKAQEWANLMTKHFDALSLKNTAFADLRNVMDMCVIAAIIEKEGLADKVGLSIPMITSPDSELKTQIWAVPTKTAAQCTALQSAGRIVLTTSGGVQVDSWQVAANVETSPKMAEIREKAGEYQPKSWWWQPAN
jgi:hypothetical protein